MAISLTMHYGDDDWAEIEYQDAPASLGLDGTVYYPAHLVGRLYKCEFCEDSYVSAEAIAAHECPDKPETGEDTNA